MSFFGDLIQTQTFHFSFLCSPLDINAKQMNVEMFVELIDPIIFSVSKESIQIWQCLNIQLD